MKRKHYDIFISYRRKDTCDKAELLKELLEKDYPQRVSFDRENLTGLFDIELIRRIDKCKDFLIVVGRDTFNFTRDDPSGTPALLNDVANPEQVELYKYLGTCSQQEFEDKIAQLGPYANLDFMRIELARALNRKGLNIVPVVPETSSSYEFSKIILPPDIAGVHRYESVFYSDSHNSLFKDMLPKLKKHLHSKPSSFRWLFSLIVLLLIVLATLGALRHTWQKNVNQLKTEIEAMDIVKDLDLRWNDHITLNELTSVYHILNLMEVVDGDTFTLGAWKNPDGTYDPDVDEFFETPGLSTTVETFWMSRFELNLQDWHGIMGGRYNANDSLLPMTNISYDDCARFVERLTVLTQLPFAIPTEAEWEFAARAGRRHQTCKYAGSDDPAAVAWFTANSGGVPHNCDGNLLSNGGNLFDMSGNVYEWCCDPFRPLGAAPGDIVPGDNPRVVKGGCFRSAPCDLRVTHRDTREANSRSDDLGLRLILRKYHNL